MGIKTLKIEIPNGYEIDKEKSTFENIVFNKIDDIVIKWNKNYYGVEIKADGEHFIVDASSPSYFCSWDDAIRFRKFYRNGNINGIWNLPTLKQLQVVDKYFDKINKVIKDNGGFVLSKGFYWSIEKKDEFCAWYVYMSNGYRNYNNKNFNYYVRAVSTL